MWRQRGRQPAEGWAGNGRACGGCLRSIFHGIIIAGSFSGLYG
jgi:hypothetical protein